MTYYIAMDVGGTEIKTCIVSNKGEIISRIEKFEARAETSKKEIIKNFITILQYMKEKADVNEQMISGIGLAFPGPFDYENGISYIKGINKYDAIYEMNLKEVLQEKFGIKIPIRFKNDADLFTLGEANYGRGKQYNKGMCICIGTGLGSGFFENKKLIVTGENIPYKGWIYQTPYKGDIADHYLSASGIKNAIRRSEKLQSTLTVKELAELGQTGNQEAIKIFEEFGEGLCEVIMPYLLRFEAQCLIIGGQVAKSFELFKRPILKGLEKHQVDILTSLESTESTLQAISTLFVEGEE